MSAVRYLVGIDEVGRGPIAGPLCVGACLILKKDEQRMRTGVRGVRDSKKLSPRQRIFWLSHIRKMEQDGILSVVTVFIGNATIDRDGMGRALRAGIRRCLKKLSVSPRNTRVILDGGIRAPADYLNQETIIRGDEKEPLIALASIVAKVRRDRLMERLAHRFPEYGFESHKGYGTRKHYTALRNYGMCGIHRRSFLREFF